MKKTARSSIIGWIIGFGAIFIGLLFSWLVSQDTLKIQGYSVILLTAIIIIVIHVFSLVYAYLKQSEKLFDTTGSLCFIIAGLAGLVAAYYSEAGLSLRGLLIGMLLLIWSTRLGIFLTVRAHRYGDKRFGPILPHLPTLFLTLMMSSIWVIVLSIVVLIGILSNYKAPFGMIEITGLLIWVIGFGIELVADHQKTVFKRTNPNSYITTGIWSRSRHPNYLGEILLWIGISIIATPVMEGWLYLGWFAPVLTFIILVFVSGVRMLEYRADKRWGKDPEYIAYKQRSGIILPKF